MDIRVCVQAALLLCLISFNSTCSNSSLTESGTPSPPSTTQPANILDYTGSPESASDRNSLVFSDQGAWFGYGFPTEPDDFGGFSGPFLMTQENGVWSSNSLSRLDLFLDDEKLDWGSFSVSQSGYLSHLKQIYTNEQCQITQTLFFDSPHSAVIETVVLNKSEGSFSLELVWSGESFLGSQRYTQAQYGIEITSEKSDATGMIQFPAEHEPQYTVSDSAYSVTLAPRTVEPGTIIRLYLTHSFVFPEYDLSEQRRRCANLDKIHATRLKARIHEKESQLDRLKSKLAPAWTDTIYQALLAKTVLTMQNNWRIPAGELKHSGLFPSYHYIWFHGFWAWDSWKHAASLAHYDPALAREQILAMLDFQNENGFIADCVYRDTSIENHNYRNTKPPLAGWALWSVFEQEMGPVYLEKVYPRIVQQHYWWYAERDHDRDGICEYGATDGTLIAAKWESGMDNAVRFDQSGIVENSEGAFSLDQESVDLNAYLYAEKIYLGKLAAELGRPEEAERFRSDAAALKNAIQTQFFDAETGWFYDTSLDGTAFIGVIGCEGWIPLWAECATQEQAAAVKMTMMNSDHFNTMVPLQTLSAAHEKFKPERGYWRGPTWLDQAYFGIKGLENYGYHEEATALTRKLIHNAEGLLEPGMSIRENYNPMTGGGLVSENFSWSAAHYLLLLIGE